MRDAKDLDSIDSCEYIASVPLGENISSMVVAYGELYVSTDKHIYILKDKKRLEQF